MREYLVQHACAVNDDKVVAQTVIRRIGDGTGAPRHCGRAEGRVARHICFGDGSVGKRRDRGIRRGAGVAVDADGAFELQALRQGIGEFEIAQRSFRHRQTQFVFDDVADAHVGVTRTVGVAGAILGDGGVDVPRRYCCRGRLRDVVVKLADAVRAVALECARAIDAGPLRDDAVRERLVVEHAVEHAHVVSDGNGLAFGDVDVGIASAKAPDQCLRCAGAAVAGNNGRADGVVGADAGADGDGRVARVDQTGAQGVGNRCIENIRRIGAAARRQRHAVAHGLAGRRRGCGRALGDCCYVRLDNIERHGPAGQRGLCGSARGVGIRVGDRVVDRNALLGAHHVAHARAQLEHRLLVGRDLGDRDIHLARDAGVGHTDNAARYGGADVFEVRIERVGDLDVVQRIGAHRAGHPDLVHHLLANGRLGGSRRDQRLRRRQGLREVGHYLRRILVVLHGGIGLTIDVGIVTVGDLVGAVDEVRLVKDHETLREGRGHCDIELDLNHAAGRNAQVADVKDPGVVRAAVRVGMGGVCSSGIAYECERAGLERWQCVEDTQVVVETKAGERLVDAPQAQRVAQRVTRHCAGDELASVRVRDGLLEEIARKHHQ